LAGFGGHRAFKQRLGPPEPHHPTIAPRRHPVNRPVAQPRTANCLNPQAEKFVDVFNTFDDCATEEEGKKLSNGCTNNP
jgi:hypothetical protein